MKESHSENKQEPIATGSEFPNRNLMVELFVQLNSARKTGEFCFCDHPRCLWAAERAAEIVNDFVEEAGEVIFSAGDRSIIAGGSRVETTEPYLADFAAALQAADINVIRLASGVSADGLVRFIRLLAACSDPAVGDGQIRQLLCGSVAEGIRVGMAPPSAVTSGDDQAGGSSDIDESVWKATVRSLLSVEPAVDENGEKADMTGGEVATNRQEAADVVLVDIDPRQLAELINSLDFAGDVDLIAGHFLVPYLQQTMDRGASKQSMVPAQTITRFLHLLRGLSPGHQLRFITAALEISYRYTLFAGAVLEAVPIHLAVQAFEGIRTEENTVHPRIVSRYEALCRLTGWSAGEVRAAVAEKGEDEIEVGGGEGTMLGALPADTPAGKPGRAPGQPLPGRQIRSAIAAEFTTAGMRKALIRVSLDLLERATSLDETRTYSDTLSGLFTEALNEKDWAGLNHDWAELTGLVGRGQKTRPFLGKALQRIQKSFLTIQAMDQIVDGIKSSTAEIRAVIQKWLPALGNAAGESLVLALIATSDRTQRRNLLSAIVAFGEAAIPLALKRITDHRWYVVRNMISIIREVGDKSAGEDILTLSRHVQFQVRRELVNTLLALQHSEGLVLAEEGIRGSDRKMRSACIGLLGSHRVDGARTLLIRILEDTFRGEIPFSQAQKVSAVWALGQIGNSTVLPALHDLLKKKRVFKSPGIHELKMAILRSLPGYPLSEVQPLAGWGASHGDEDEATMCSRMIKEIKALPEEKNQ